MASNAISSVPINAPRAVAINTLENLGSAVPPHRILFGLTVKMYAIAKNVVIPANISILFLEPLSRISKKESNLLLFPLFFTKLFLSRK